MKVTPLSWDSTFFGLRVSKIQLEKEIFSITEELSFDLIYLLSPTSTIPKIKNFTATFTQGKIFFEKKLTTISEEPKSIYSFSELNLSPRSLYSLGYESGQYSRFKLDPQFSEKKFNRLYESWVEASCNRSFAKEVLVYMVENEPVGFITYSVSEKEGTIGLVSVKPNFQGNGIGSALLKAVENALIKLDCVNLLIPTQIDNKSACSFYKKMGYLEKETTFITHYWRQ